MAAEPQRSNQPLVNGQNDDGSSSRGSADRDTVGGEPNQEQQESQRARPPPQLNWPRQQRPQEFGRGYPQAPNRLPLQGIRRASPWTVLKTKLPDQPQIRPGNEYPIQRMQNPDGSFNGVARPPSAGMVRPPGPMSRPPSQENSLTPTPGGPPPRSPFLQRADSRTGSPMAGMPRQMSAGRPPSVASTGRSLDDDDDVVMTGSPQSRPGSARPIQSPVGVRPGSGPPVRPPSRTPPQSPGAPMMPPMRSPQPGRQSSLSSLAEQGEQKSDGVPLSRPPSVTPNPSRPQSALRPDSGASLPPIPDTQLKQPLNGEKSPSINESDDPPKRPTDLSRPSKGDAPSTNGEVKDSTNDQSKKEAVVNGSQESPKKSPSKASAPKKLGNVQTPVKSPSKISPKTPDTPGTAEKKNLSSINAELDTTEQQIHNENTENTNIDPQFTDEILEVQKTQYDTQWQEEYSEQEVYDTQYQYSDICETQDDAQFTKEDYQSLYTTNVQETTQETFQEEMVQDVIKQKSDIDITPETHLNQPLQEQKPKNTEVKGKKQTNHTEKLKSTEHPGEFNVKRQTQRNIKKQTEPPSGRPKVNPVKKPKFPIPDENTEQKSEPNIAPQNRVHFAQEPPKPNVTTPTTTIIQEEQKTRTETEEQQKPPPPPTPKPATPASPKRSIMKQDSLQKQLPETPPIKIPMNKVQVGAAPSPNLKCIKSKIGSLENAKHKPGGGKIKIENRKLNFSATPKIAAKNDAYAPKGGEKKIQNVKLQWNAKSKIGSLDNASHKPGGGDKKIESVKLDFKDKAKPKVGSKDNIKHTPGGGTIKNSEGSQDGNPSDIEDQKLEIKATSKIGSLDNVKHKPGGGEIKIFDDKDYLKQMAGPSDVHTPSHQGKKSRSNSTSSRQKLSESGTTENLAEVKSPEKKVEKPMDQNSNQLKSGGGKGEIRKDTNGNGNAASQKPIEKKDQPNSQIEDKTNPKPEPPNVKNPLPPQPTIKYTPPNDPLPPNQSNGVVKVSPEKTVVEKSLIEKTEKEMQKPIELNKQEIK